MCRLARLFSFQRQHSFQTRNGIFHRYDILVHLHLRQKGLPLSLIQIIQYHHVSLIQELDPHFLLLCTEIMIQDLSCSHQTLTQIDLISWNQFLVNLTHLEKAQTLFVLRPEYHSHMS